MSNTINAATLALNTASEQCRLTAYDDKQPDKKLADGDPIIGTLSIGYGHTGPDVYIGQTCTQEQADTWRVNDLGTAEDAVRAATPATLALTNNEFGAISDFVYNVGTGNFQKSTLRRLLTKGQLTSIPAEFGKWVFAKGVKEAGLVKRRAQEAHLFMTPDAEPITLSPASGPSMTPDPVVQKSLLTSTTAWGMAAGGAVLAAQPDIQAASQQLIPYSDVAPFIPKLCHWLGIAGVCTAMVSHLRSIRRHNGTATS